MGIGVPLKGIMGEAVGEGAGAAIGITAGILDSPKVKARIAIALSDMKRLGVAIDPEWPVFTLGLAEYGKYKEKEN